MQTLTTPSRGKRIVRRIGLSQLVLAGLLAGATSRGDDTARQHGKVREVIAQHEKGYSARADAIMRQYATALGEMMAGKDREAINAYEALFDMSDEEYRATKTSTLFQEVQFDYSRIPLLVAQVCRDSNSLSPSEAIAAILRQRLRNADPRISGILVPYIKTHESLTSAIDFCAQRVAAGEDEFQMPLTSLRIEYQAELIRRALTERGLETWDPNIVEQTQLDIALAEAKEAVTRNSALIQEFDKVFHDAWDTFDAHAKACDFYRFAKIRVEEQPIVDANLVRMLSERLQHEMGLSGAGGERR